MNYRKYLKKLNWTLNHDKISNSYWITHQGIKISSFSVDNDYPDTILILIKNTIKELQDLKCRGMLGLWFQIKLKLKIVSDRISSSDKSIKNTMRFINNISSNHLKVTSISHYYDQLDLLENTKKLNQNIYESLRKEYFEIFGEQPTC